MSQAIQLYDKIVDPLDAIAKMGEFLAKSGMFGCEKVEQGKVLAMVCMCENKSPTQLLRTYHLVDGKLSKKALAALAEFRQMGGKHKWIADGQDGKKATLEVTSPDGMTMQYTYTIETATKEGLVKPGSRWVKGPGNMLRARCISNLLAMVVPEIFAGEEDDNEPEGKQLLPKQEAETTTPTEVHIEQAETSEPAPQPAKRGRPPKEKHTINVEATTISEPAKPADEAPAQKPEPASEKPADPLPQKTNAESEANGRLTKDTVAAIMALTPSPELQEKAIKKLTEKRWIPEGGNLFNMSLPRAQKILTEPEAYLAWINKE